MTQVSASREGSLGGQGGSRSGHGRLRRSHSESLPRRTGRQATQRLRKEMSRQKKLMEDSSALLDELTARIRRTGVQLDDSFWSSGSDSEAMTEPDRDEREDEDEETALLRACNESSTALWKMHRQTVRLLLEHLDRLGFGSGVGSGPIGATHGLLPGSGGGVGGGGTAAHQREALLRSLGNSGGGGGGSPPPPAGVTPLRLPLREVSETSPRQLVSARSENSNGLGMAMSKPAARSGQEKEKMHINAAPAKPSVTPSFLVGGDSRGVER